MCVFEGDSPTTKLTTRESPKEKRGGHLRVQTLVFLYPTDYQCLPEAARLALPLQQAQNITLPDRPLDVADDGTAGVVDELDADLGDVAGVAGAAEDAVHFRELYGLIHC